jgi:dihydropteroate synthase
VQAGASMVNDVSALSHDPAMAGTVAGLGVPLCLMHAQGTPQTMQADPRYDDVLGEVYDHLAARIAVAIEAGIPRDRLIVDPGIGFGKTVDHNLALLRRIGLFHGLGVPILLGVSRKRFIGVIGNAPDVGERLPGSLAVALAAIQQGVQIIRVHDTRATKQAIDLWRAVTGNG